MASEIIHISPEKNIINTVSGYLSGKDGKTAVISGGKRPFLFIKKSLSEKNKKSFFSPYFTGNDDFIENIGFEHNAFSKIPDIEAAYMLYGLAFAIDPGLFKGNKDFVHFIGWAKEILLFIEQLDLENVSEDALKNIKANAEIGYDVPEHINNLLKNIFTIRKAFHKKLENEKKTTKGYSFLSVSKLTADITAKNFDEIVLIAPFFLHKTELEIYKKIFDAGKLTVFVHGSPCEYPILKKIYTAMRYPMPESEPKSKQFDLNVYCAYDGQSQALLLKNLISKLPQEQYDKTVVVVPDQKLLQPVIAEMSSVTDNFNISAGYPAAKTSVFGLVRAIVDAQLSKKEYAYYSKDVIKVLADPLVKNMRFMGDASLSRIVVHKIQEALDVSSKSSFAGKLFVKLSDIYSDETLLKEISLSVTGAWSFVSPERVKETLKSIFAELFFNWEQNNTLYGFADVLEAFVRKTASLSTAQSYPLNGQVLELLLHAAQELRYGEVAKVQLGHDEVLNLFIDSVKDKKIALKGSPLNGIQVLGLLESRNLAFDNVYVTGMTDSAIPAIQKESPLIPKSIMYALGIETAGKELEIQKYHFDRLIAGAKSVNLIYPDNEREERSRFIESLVWEKQLAAKNIKSAAAAVFSLPLTKLVNKTKRKYEKTPQIKDFLKKMPYSYSKIDTYLRCKLEFYFKYVLSLDERIEIGKEVSGSDIGSFIHEFLKSVFYEGLSRSDLQETGFEREYMDKLERQFENAFNLKFREDAFLIKKVLMHRMKALLAFETGRQYKNIYSCEKKYKSSIETESGNYVTECIIDRIDIIDGGYLILDYKTGNVNAPVVSRNFQELLPGFKRENIKKAVRSLQLPLYKYIFEQNERKKAENCGIYDIKKAEIIDFYGKNDNKDEIFDGCVEIIKHILDDINAGSYFEFEENDAVKCENCKYFYICR